MAAQDSDSDSRSHTPELKYDEVTLNLHVKPVAGDIEIKGVEGDEDTAIAFLENVKITDDSDVAGTLGEVITKVSFKLPEGWTPNADGTVWTNDANANQQWTVTEPTGETGYTVSFDGDEYVITFAPDSTLTREDREEILGKFTITPPAHSSKDVELDIKVTSKDFSQIDGGQSSAEVTLEGKLKVTVTPTAEKIAGEYNADGNWVPAVNDEISDTDGNSKPDLTMNGSHTYQAPGKEDEWFPLGADTGFDLKAGWTNEDGQGPANGGPAEGSEKTYARLTPELTDGSGNAVNAKGSEFQWGPVDAEGNHQFSAVYGDEPIDVPMEYLDTLKFKATPHFSGEFKIKVEAKTVDFDEDFPGDESKANTQISGEAWLTNSVLPVADEVTLAVSGLTKGDEDTAIALDIRPTSSDPSETFVVKISDIPEGAKIHYDGSDEPLVLTGPDANGKYSVEIPGFDSDKALTITPPLHSNEDFDLDITAKSVDDPNNTEWGSDESAWAPSETITVEVKGVADGGELVVVDDPALVEDDIDNADGKVALKSLITGITLIDADGSETPTLKITLDEPITLTGGVSLGNGVWLLTQGELKTAELNFPPHYSGTLKIGAQLIVTENDGDEKLGDKKELIFTVTPSPEGKLTDSTKINEDIKTKMHFALESEDDKETLNSVWIKVDDTSDPDEFTLYWGDSEMTLAEALAAGEEGIESVTADGATWYKLTGSAIDNVYAQGAPNSHESYDISVKYEVSNESTDGTVGAATSAPVDGTHNLNIVAVTDKASLEINSIKVGDTVLADGDTDVEITGTTNLTVNLTLSKDGDPKAGGDSDYDGSERLTGVIIEGVPEGVTVDNAIYIGNVPGEDGNTGRWLLAKDEKIEGETTFDVTFSVNGSAEALAGLSKEQIIIIAVTKDAGEEAQEVTADAALTLTTPTDPDDFNKDDTVPGLTVPADINTWELKDFTGTEDIEFKLGEVVTGTVAADASSDPVAITITGLGAGTVVEGMTETLVDGVPTWTWTGSASELQTILDAITIEPPKDHNTNHEDWSFNVTLTTYGTNGEREAQSVVVKPQLEPVTDPAEITVTTEMPVVAEGQDEESEVIFKVSVEPGVDGEFGTVVDGKLYVKVTADGALAGGTLSYPDGTLGTATNPVGLPEGTYYVIENVEFGDSLELIYKGPAYASGDVSLEAYFGTQEKNADNIRYGSGSAEATVEPVNSGYQFTDEDGVEITEVTASGEENEKIPLNISGNLTDNDGSEEIVAVFLHDVPEGFLVYVNGTLANNAGEGTWSVPVTGSTLPDIQIEPPRYWSGEEDMKLVVQTQDGDLPAIGTELTVNLEVTPVANGIDISPTLTFGDEGDIIPINLNAAMPDQDGSETAVLTFTGLGPNVAFFAGDTLLEDGVGGFGYTYEGGVYTLTGLTHEQVDTLGFKQAAGVITGPVTVTAQTVDGEKMSGTETGTFDVHITPEVATSGDNTWLYGGQTIDGRGTSDTDTIQLRFNEEVTGSELAGNLKNIEVIDMSGAASGENQITGLTMQDVLDMTDSRNELKILGDENDSIELNQNNWTESGSGSDDKGSYAIYIAGDAKVHVYEEVKIIID